jgi:hypothetical protein
MRRAIVTFADARVVSLIGFYIIIIVRTKKMAQNWFSGSVRREKPMDSMPNTRPFLSEKISPQIPPDTWPSYLCGLLPPRALK